VELKKFQKAVISDLSEYLDFLPKMSASDAFSAFWAAKDVPLQIGEHYRDTLGGVPNVCVKVPTGGGKTFIACASVALIFDSLPHTKTKAVVWLVPSDSILEQTLTNLQNTAHSYRERLNADFQYRVQVYAKAELLNGQNFSPSSVTQQLSVFVLSYDSFRTSKKEGRKAYQENGNLAAFAEFFGDKSLLLADTDETALINVIRKLNPVVIVDESHHAVSVLSKEMLQNFNPSLVLDLTATPKKDANIISYVDAMQLKRENMVKLPVIVYNMRTKSEVIGEAIYARRKLEAEATAEKKRTGRYIRPIALFQAAPKGKDDNTTFERLKKDLIDAGIPQSHIAIKTADINELRGVDLLSPDCPVRYIVTVNAL
jgi:type III restriction enzyme